MAAIVRSLRLTTPVRRIERVSEWGQRGARYHHGIDLYSPADVPVYAAAQGYVAASVPSGEPGYGRYGQTVRISHADGTQTLYAHLNRRDVLKNQWVRGGQQIGLVGDTRGTPMDPGARFEVSEPHVHFEVLVGPYPASRGAPAGTGPLRSMNPRAWFERHGQQLGHDPSSWNWFAIAGAGAILIGGFGWLVWSTGKSS